MCRAAHTAQTIFKQDHLLPLLHLHNSLELVCRLLEVGIHKPFGVRLDLRGERVTDRNRKKKLTGSSEQVEDPLLHLLKRLWSPVGEREAARSNFRERPRLHLVSIRALGATGSQWTAGGAEAMDGSARDFARVLGRRILNRISVRGGPYPGDPER
eukprot:6205610-Pleurochrysis_carterae.AAC.2